MRWIITWAPFVINVIVMFKEPVAYIFIPASLFLGMILLLIYSCIGMKNSTPGTKEYETHKRDRDEAIVGIIASARTSYKENKKMVKDIMDVDKWG